MNQPAQNGARLTGYPGNARRKTWFTTTNSAARPRMPSSPASHFREGPAPAGTATRAGCGTRARPTRSMSTLTMGYRVPGCEPNAPRKRSRNALIGQTGAVGVGRMPSTQPHPAILRITAGSWAMTEMGTS